MPDLKQALKDFVATSNSGKYTDEATLLSKFPELKGYDVQALRDFVATSNSGKYATEEEVFSKFPEFNVQGELVKKDYKGLMGISADIQVKKKEQPIPLEPQLATQQPTTPQSPMALPSEDSFLASQKQLPTFETTPLKKEVSKPITKKEESLDFLDPILKTITPELINKNEEFVVPKMNYQFGDLGFKFEESGVTGDYMIATAPNGKKTTISLDPLFTSKAESQSEKLKSFIKENSKGMDKLSTMSKLYYDEGRKFETQKEVDNSIKQINNDATVLNQQIGNFLKQKKQLETQFSELSNTPENLRNTPEYIAKSQAVSKAQERLESDRNFILYSQKNIESRNKSLEKAVGRYTEMKSEQWAWYEVPLKSLAKGVGSLASGFYGASIDIINNYAPKGMLMSPEKWTSESLRIAKKLGLGEPSVGQSEDKWLNSLSQTEKDKIESEVRDSLKKRDKNMLVGGEAQDPAYIKSKYIELAEKEGIEGPKSDSKEDYNKWLNTISDSKKQEFDAVITEESIGGVTISNLIRNSVSNQLPINTTEEAYADIQKGFVGGALTGAIESIPSFLGGGKISRVIRLFAQAEDATMRDMENNPAFEGVSENEKRLVSAPISIATAILEEVGFRNVIASKGLLNGVVARALGKSGATTTARTFADFIRNDVDNMIARGALKLVGGALAEAETGALQQGVQLAVQKIYNEVKEKKMYKLPEDAGGVIADILRSGAQEAIGGFVLGMPSAVSAAYTKKGFLGMNDATFKAFEAAANDENIQKAFVTKLKNQVNQGEITIEQAKETLNNYRNSIGLFKSMPEGLDTQAKKEAMNLLKEKRDLENQTIGKDPALVKPLTDRINIINESLTKLSEDAIQEQAADESVLRTGEPQMGLQEVGEGNVQPEVVTAGTESQVLTNEEQERKVALENAFETPNTEDNTIAIGEEVIPIENAQAELDALRSREVTSMEKQFGKEFPTAPTTDQGVSVTNKSAVDNIKTKTTDKGKVKVIEAAERVLKTLKSVLPNFDIVLHNDEGSFNAAMSSINATQGTRGNFAIYEDGSGRIDINLSRANSRTVAHEVAHAVMAKAFNGTPALYKGFRDRISKVLNESSNKKLMDFAKNYTGDVTYEEYLAELTAMLEQEEANLSVNTLQKIAAIINEIVSKITNGTFKPFEDIKDTKQVVDFFKSISESIRKGEEISPADIEAIQEGLSLPIGSPTNITRSQKGGSLTFTKEPLPLSFVTEADKIDINKLIDEIIEKKQNVWFWMADQLGRGNYYDAVIGNDHYLDAGPSFALDPKNRSKNILWASGLPDKTLQSQIDKADYIFFISGSPEKAKLFNRRVLDLIASRINKTSDFNSFKDAMNNFKTETNELKDIKDALVKINSFDELAKSPRRKAFLIAIDNVGKNKTTPKGSLKELLSSFNAFIDYNELRDGFYKENDFTQNDIMLVGKPTGLGGSAPHSTYETAILGEVVGVPDTKIDSWNIMPQALRDKYQSVIGGRETKTKAMQAKVIAAETGVVRGLEAKPTNLLEGTEVPISKSHIVGEKAILSATADFNKNLAITMSESKSSPLDIRIATGWEKGADGEWRYEIPDGKYKDIDVDDLQKEMDYDGKTVRIAKLSDVFDAPDLYQAYPEAKNIKVGFKDLTAKKGYKLYGSYVKALNRINVNENIYKEDRYEAELTMLHEIQHYIQGKEFFEKGSSDSKSIDAIKKAENDFKNKLDTQKKVYQDLKKSSPESKEAIKDAIELYNIIKDGYQEIKYLGKFKLNKKDKIAVLNAIEDANKWRKENSMPLITLKDALKDKVRKDAYNIYLRVAGEVEARNVPKRNKLTPEEKRRTLLSETEDFYREDQILLSNKDFYLTKEYKEMNKEFPLSKSQVDATNVVNKIVKDARAQGFSEESIRLFLESKGLDANDIKTAMQPEIPASKKATVTETMLAGFDTLMNKIDALINKNTADKDVISFLKNDKAYTNATDIQKDDMVRQVRAKLGLKQKSAPTADRLLGAIKNLAKITMTEKQALVKQIKDLSRGAKDAKKAITEAYKQLSKEVKALAAEGTLTVNQAANVLRAFSKVNVLSQTSVNRFTDYMTKVFANAEYASKLTTAKSLRKDISKLSKNKEKNANLRDLAQQFAKINPSMVEDIDAYNDMASKIKEATKGSTIRLGKPTFAETVNIENASKYINETIKAQDEMIRQERIAEIQELMGIDASEFSAEDMLALLESEKPITKYNEGIVREAINKMFNIYSTLINETIKQGRDPFTDEEVNFTTAQKDVVKRFMAMDLSLLTPKEALQAVDALANFLQNSSTARMESVLSKYTGNLKAKEIVDKGIVASPLMKYWSKSFGRFLGEQTTNLNILFEKMFKGFNKGGTVEDASALTKLKNNKSMAERESNNIVEKYVSQFYKRQANGEAYNTEYNSVERGLTAFMMRNVIGTEAEMKAEFNRRKKLIEQSIKVLSEGSEKEKTKSELYQKIYDKILKDSKSIQEVKDKTDPTNLEGIEYWMNEWADKYEQLSDVSLNVYNKVLDKDLNYTPDRFVKLKSEMGNVELNNDESAFFYNSDGVIYKKETGVLMTAVKPETLPTNIDNGETNMYIDLSFDKNNSSSMYDALIDINTAAPIRQIQAFLNSPNFKKIVPESDDATLLKGRIALYVRNIRNKNPYSNDELSAAVRKLNKIASIGVGQALGGIFQPLKQMVPVAMNTIVNAGGLDVNAIFDSAKNAFINRSGYAIANRGIESQAQVESLNKLIDEASKSTGEKMFKAVEKWNRIWLDIFLVKGDVAIARASWITYYEQSLKKQGIDTSGIDYNTHEVNQDAADYAQRMVDRQQNVSDADLSGKFFANKEANSQLLVKTLMPFASFRMNQASRFGADLGTLGDKTATVEDKKIAIKSLGGFAVEMVVFRMIGAGSAILLGSFAMRALGKDEDDEDFKKRVDNIIKGQATGTFTDLFSPLPLIDKAIQAGGNALIKFVQDAVNIPEEDQYNIFRIGMQDALQSLGLFGIAADRVLQLKDMAKLASTGKYTDDFGKEKKISEKDQKVIGYFIGPAILTNIGLAPVEVNNVIRNTIKYSKKATKTPEEKKQALENAENKLEQKERKISALEYLKKRATSQQMYNTIEEKLKEINATGEEKDKIEERNKEEKKLKDELLFDPRKGVKYDNESDMKKYSPSIYNRNFGVRSEWYRSHKIEEAVDKKVNEVIRKIKDREYKNKKP